MKSFLSVLVLGLLFFCFRPSTEFTVHGQVIDSTSGNSIAGATVKIKGTSLSTVTATDGSFTLKVPSDKAILIVTYLGYDVEEISVAPNEPALTIRMNVSEDKLREVVVTGYTAQRRKDISGSVTAPRNSQAAPAAVRRGAVANLEIADVKLYRQKEKSAPEKDEDEAYNREGYDGITENRFLAATQNPLSTFSIDVDGASYSNVRRILNQGELPPAGAVRIEEFINYFHYDYPQPTTEEPFSINTEISDCPWSNKNKLVMIGLQGKKIPTENLPASNLVFLIDVSGSMMDENKLPLVRSSMKLLVDQLREQDRVSIVVYAGNAGLVLPSTAGSEKNQIKEAIDRLEAGGSTAGGAGIKLAYKVARDHFVPEGNNRVILCTDGDFNVGASSDASLEQLIENERKSGVYLTVLGYGMGNYQDAKMQKLADKGNGNHAYIDDISEARKVLVNEFGGTLFTIAKDVKLQVEFNPTKVQAYRLVGYENRLLNKEDFNNDKKDAGELGSGHTVTALYEIIPTGVESEFVEPVDPLKYQWPKSMAHPTWDKELMTIKFRYKKPGEDQSKLIVHPVTDQRISVKNTSDNFRFVAAVAQFGLLLRNSEFREAASFRNAINLATSAVGNDREGYRKEFLALMKKADNIKGKVERKDSEQEDVGSR